MGKGVDFFARKNEQPERWRRPTRMYAAPHACMKRPWTRVHVSLLGLVLLMLVPCRPQTLSSSSSSSSWMLSLRSHVPSFELWRSLQGCVIAMCAHHDISSWVIDVIFAFIRRGPPEAYWSQVFTALENLAREAPETMLKDIAHFVHWFVTAPTDVVPTLTNRRDACKAVSHQVLCEWTSNNACKEALIAAGIFEKLLSLLSTVDQFDAMHLMLNLVQADDDTCKLAIMAAGAVDPLVKMLAWDPSRYSLEVLLRLADGGDACKEALIAGETMTQLSEILSFSRMARMTSSRPSWHLLVTTPSKMEVTVRVASVLQRLAGGNDTCKERIVDAGAVVPLAKLLLSSAPMCCKAPASGVLHALARGNATCKKAVLAALTPHHRQLMDLLPEVYTELYCVLEEAALMLLETAAAETDECVLEEALAHACGFLERNVPPFKHRPSIDRARARLTELRNEAARQAQLAVYGLSALSLPESFQCPITLDTMRGACARRPNYPELPLPCSPLTPPPNPWSQIRWLRATATRTSAARSSGCCALVNPPSVRARGSGSSLWSTRTAR